MSVFNNVKNGLDRQMFLDPAGALGIQRYDVVRYPIFLKLTKQQNSFFWLPEEVDCTKDGKDFRQLSEHEQHIFTSNIKRQILLDSIQGRAPAQVLGPIATVPEIEAFTTVWTAFEQIHSMSYTHIIQGIYPNPSEVLDSIMDNELIVSLAENISKYYDDLDQYNMRASQDGYKANRADLLEHKRLLWLCLNAINALEGIRFYVSFACSWAFADLKKMEGNAKIIKFIARDENIHLAATQHMIKMLPNEDKDFARIREQCKEEVAEIFAEVVQQEKDWARYLFQDGSMIGLNYDLLEDYVEYIAHKRMLNIGVSSPYKGGSNPLPWTQKWIKGDNVRVAPQETESTLYVQGIKKGVDEGKLASFEL